MRSLISVDRIERRIFLVRGHRTMVESVKKSARDEVVTNCDHLQKLKFSPNRRSAHKSGRIFLAVFCGLLFAHDTQASEVGVPYGAGLPSMGGPGAALLNIDGFSRNPAGAAFTKTTQVMLGGEASTPNLVRGQLLAIYPFFKRYTVAAGFSRGSIGKITRYDVNNVALPSFSFGSTRLTLGGGWLASGSFATGMSLNYYSEGAPMGKAGSNLLLDFGGAFAYKGWSVGVSGLHFGSRKSSEVRLGFARERPLHVELESVYNLRDGVPYFTFGVEYPMPFNFVVRGAYHTGPQSLNRLGFASGLGFGFGFVKGRIRADYSFKPAGFVGFGHVLAMSFTLGKTRAAPARAPYSGMETKTPSIPAPGILRPATPEELPAPQVEAPIGIPPSQFTVSTQPAPAELTPQAAQFADVRRDAGLFAGECQRLGMNVLDPDRYRAAMALYSEIEARLDAEDRIGAILILNEAQAILDTFKKEKSQQAYAQKSAEELSQGWTQFVSDIEAAASGVSGLRIRRYPGAVVVEMVAFELKGYIDEARVAPLKAILPTIKKNAAYDILIRGVAPEGGLRSAEGVKTFLEAESVGAQRVNVAGKIGSPPAVFISISPQPPSRPK